MRYDVRILCAIRISQQLIHPLERLQRTKRTQNSLVPIDSGTPSQYPKFPRQTRRRPTLILRTRTGSVKCLTLLGFTCQGSYDSSSLGKKSTSATLTVESDG
ncbi:hypothetical protein ACJMK2_044473 [Sinanodonta woodiana]|uniref:Uncharacterized protein n=1 Tax=Sinanodonta woodiana TaxID=1069815 RepID=A0ABD3W205_SINWO